MARRILRIDPELLVSILSGFDQVGVPRKFVVTQDPIPADAKILSVRYSPYYTDTIDVALESSQWPEVDDGTSITPRLSAIYDERPIISP